MLMCSCTFNSPKPFTQWRILLSRSLRALFYFYFFLFPFLFSCNNWFTDKSIYPGLIISAKSTFDKQPHWATTLPTVKLQQTFPDRRARRSKYKKKYKSWCRIEGGRERGCCVMQHARRGARCAGGDPQKARRCVLPGIRHCIPSTEPASLRIPCWAVPADGPTGTAERREKPSQCKEWLSHF